MILKKHEQHTAEFLKELNSVNNNVPFTPFRISDEIWLIGKHKGKKIQDIPVSYLLWAIQNLKLSETASIKLLELKNKYNKKCTIIKKQL